MLYEKKKNKGSFEKKIGFFLEFETIFFSDKNEKKKRKGKKQEEIKKTKKKK